MHRKKKTGRGRLSSIDLLPEDIKAQLNAALREKRLTQKQILDAVNPLLAERGKTPVSKSALGRYAMSVEEKGAMMREAREAAKALVGKFEEHSDSDIGRLLSEMIKTLTFERVMTGGDLDVPELNKLALIAQRMARTSKIDLERDKAVKQQMAEKAKERINELEKQGFDPSTLKASIEAVYGIAATG